MSIRTGSRSCAPTQTVTDRVCHSSRPCPQQDRSPGKNARPMRQSRTFARCSMWAQPLSSLWLE
jgi:hypothetical protein